MLYYTYYIINLLYTILTLYYTYYIMYLLYTMLTYLSDVVSHFD